MGINPRPVTVRSMGVPAMLRTARIPVILESFYFPRLFLAVLGVLYAPLRARPTVGLGSYVVICPAKLPSSHASGVLGSHWHPIRLRAQRLFELEFKRLETRVAPGLFRDPQASAPGGLLSCS